MANKNKLNIAPVISPDILKTISASTIIKTFGDQLKNKAKETVISYTQNKVGELTNQLEQIVKDEIQAGIDYDNRKKQIESNKDKYPSEEEYLAALNENQISYNEQKLAFAAQKIQLQTNINNILQDPYQQIKNQQKLFKEKIKKLKKSTQNTESRSKRDLAKQVASNAVKTLIPIVALQLTNQFSNVITQRKKLEDLVNQVNNYIDTQVKDTQTAAIATNLRNNAIALINNNIKKLNNLGETLKTIQIIITIFALILRIITSLPLPITSTVADRLVKASNLVLGLSALLSIATNLLSNEIIRLNELRDRLKEISLKLDGKSLDNLEGLTNFFLPTGGKYPPYKGFNFNIKEEQDPRFVVKGNKRRYAVATNRDGVEQIKSDYSFTLDPNDLIEQLKLVIDQRNLQG